MEPFKPKVIAAFAASRPLEGPGGRGGDTGDAEVKRGAEKIDLGWPSPASRPLGGSGHHQGPSGIDA